MITRTGLILLIFITTTSYGQVIENVDNYVVRVTDTTIEPNSYYVIKADNKQVEFFGDSIEFKSNPMMALDPNWIKAISIYKGEKAINEFGDKGLNGVIIIELKRRRLKRLPDDLQRQFVPKDTNF